ncbi:tetratricopeptide repeat protein [Rhodopseudomonas sp.]|uniref:tetratricopeptide repeat protein n=1 Tax=Rhodopseudomonas sp. TaxID=1078 RepID=UPI0025DA459F|nr:tetratricopeptide repeat protein [Rhodopseudomonas sp.]
MPSTARVTSHAAAPLPSYIVDTSQPPLGFEGNHAIAVLPFSNLTGDEAHDYLAEGISEELIAGLSRLRWLPVIARNSSFSFADTVDRKSIGLQLGARYLLEGHLYRSCESYGISASLSESVTGYAIWSRRFALPSPTSRDLLEQFVNELVAHLETKIGHVEQTRTRAKREESLGVNDLIWRGRWHINRLTRTDSEMAQKLFAEALELDPHSPEALIQVTAALGWAIWAGRQPQDQILRMRKLAQQATLVDPDDGRGFMLAGIAEMWLRHPLPAKALLQQAIALNPSLMLAHAQLGGSHNLAGEPEQAIVHLKAALRLSTNDPNMFYSLGELALAYTLLGRWSDAIEHADHALARRPAYWYAHVIKINAVARSGDIVGGQAALGELFAVKPNFSKQYIDWLPFVDRTWIDHFVEGLKLVSGRRTDWLERDTHKSPAQFQAT